jgi:HlyD family secretion protein
VTEPPVPLVNFAPNCEAAVKRVIFIYFVAACNFLPCATHAAAPANITALGTVEPTNQIAVSTATGGLVKELGADAKDPSKTVDYGDHVKRGQVLLRLDSAIEEVTVAKAKAALDGARSQLAGAKACLAKAQVDIERQTRLANSARGNTLDIESAKFESEVAKAKVDVQTAVIAEREADLKLAEISLDRRTIISPVDGLIIDRRVNVGSSVPANENLFLIWEDSKKLQIWVAANERDIARIAIGQSAHFTVDAFPNKTFSGKVSQVRLNAQMSNNAVTYTVVIDVDDSEKLLPYMTAKVEIDANAEK